MSTQTSFQELLKMPPEDLLRETAQQRERVTKMRLGIEVGKEKDTARYSREKRHLATMLTALRQRKEPSLPATPRNRTV